MPIPPVKEAVEIDGVSYYEFVLRQFTKQLYKDGRGPTTFEGYDGMVPGPTIKQKRGTNSVLRMVNNMTSDAAVVHLHGSYSRAPFDGWAEDLINPSQFKDYYYPNGQAGRTMWYHDHAMDHTAEHNFFGQFGQYHVVDEEVESALNLPWGKYDVPLSISSHQFNEDGSLWSPDANNERRSVYGDVIMANGIPWPKMTVEPRKYRFRLLDSAVSRSFLLYLTEDESEEPPCKPWKGGRRPRGHRRHRRRLRSVTRFLRNRVHRHVLGRQEEVPEQEPVDPTTLPKVPMTVVASDSGYLSEPITVDQLYLSMAERYEVVIDFSKFAGKKLTLRNVRGFARDTDYKHTDKVLQFHVKKRSSYDTSSVPNSLVKISYPPPPAESDVRSFAFNGAPGVGWTINGARFDDIENRVLAKPQRGNVERWVLTNRSPAWSHPIHVHLVDFRIISRTGANREVLPYESVGLKDVVWLNAGETVVVDAVFAPWEGVYMFHCHNLVHEDHAMMAAFNVTLLEEFGYEERMHFVDPVNPTYAAKDCDVNNVETRTGVFEASAIEKVISDFSDTGAYKDIDGIVDALEEYWEDKRS